MQDNSIDVFGRAMLYIYQAGLENLGLKGDLRVVRKADAEKKMVYKPVFRQRVLNAEGL